MQDDRLLKQAVFGINDGKNKRGRPKRRCTDYLVDFMVQQGYLYGLESGEVEVEVEQSLTPHPTQYRSFRRRSSQPIT